MTSPLMQLWKKNKQSCSLVDHPVRSSPAARRRRGQYPGRRGANHRRLLTYRSRRKCAAAFFDRTMLASRLANSVPFLFYLVSFLPLAKAYICM